MDASSIAREKGTRYAWVVTATAFLGQITAVLVLQLWGMNLTTIADDFGVDTLSLSMGASVFGLLYGLLCVFWGNLADKVGLRKTMAVGLFGAGVVLLATAFVAQSPFAVMAGYSLVGVFLGAVGVAIVPKIASSWFSTHSRGMGSALMIVGGSFGGVFFGLVAPKLIGCGGWRACFMGVGVFILVVGVLVALFMRDSPESMGKKPYGIERETAEVVDQNTIQESIGGESNKDRIVRILKMPNMWKMAIVFILYQIYYVGHTTFFITSLTTVGFSIEVAGAISSVTYIGICVGQIAFPTISDRFARKNILGGTLLVAGVVYMSLYWILQQGIGAGSLMIFMGFAGVLFACNAMMQVTMTEMFPPDLRGAGPGMVNTFGLVGKFFSPILCSFFVANFMGGNVLGFLLFTGPCAIVAAFIALFALPKTSGKYGDPLAEQYAKDLNASKDAA